ncbi:MAG TPA: YihY/virulence factor BrkB family protein [Anaerolineales bacterium]|jgi:membrane protein|nr:YihY/virulence factor BrkB family protein [Anaerolineales bacterium]
MNIKTFYENINQLSGNRFRILETAIRSFTEKQAAQASAGLAYYTFFSIFPLMLVFVAGGSYFLDSHQVFSTVTQFIQQALPISRQVINENIEDILEQRGTAGIISLLILLWSASGMFTNLAYNINLAWPRATRRNFLQNRLVGLWMIVGLIGLIILSLLLSWLTGRLPFMNLDSTSPADLVALRIISAVGSWLMIFLAFLTLYHWIPTLRVRWSATLWGALIASLAWKAVTTGFSWYLGSSFGQYQLVYGSLGAIVAFLFLIYIISLITLFGAHLSAAIEGWEGEQAQPLAA